MNNYCMTCDTINLSICYINKECRSSLLVKILVGERNRLTDKKKISYLSSSLCVSIEILRKIHTSISDDRNYLKK